MSTVNYCWNLQDTVHQMHKTRGADYGNWGVFVDEGEIYFGKICPKRKDLTLPLLDIISSADDRFPEYGRDELTVLFRIDDKGKLRWDINPDT